VEENFWFARDVDRMAEALGTEPYLVVAESNPGERPVPAPVTVNLRNDHLEYAITWFALAAGWAAMTAALVLRILRRGRI
jgi:surfeit locus 1 family protein